MGSLAGLLDLDVNICGKGFSFRSGLQLRSQPEIWSCKCKFFCVYRPYEISISKEMNNDNDINLHLHDQMSGWLRYCWAYVYLGQVKLVGFKATTQDSFGSVLQRIATLDISLLFITFSPNVRQCMFVRFHRIIKLTKGVKCVKYS